MAHTPKPQQISREFISLQLAKLAAAIPNADLNDLTADEFIESIEEANPSPLALEAARKRIRTTFKFFPSVAELLEILRDEELRERREQMNRRALKPYQFDESDAINWQEGTKIINEVLARMNKPPIPENQPIGTVLTGVFGNVPATSPQTWDARRDEIKQSAQLDSEEIQ